MMVPPHSLRLTLMLTLGGLLLLAAPVQATTAAQSPTARSGHEPWPGSVGAVDRHVDLRKPPLQRRVATALSDRPLAEALERLAREAGFTLAYATDILPEDLRVSTPPGTHVAGDLLALWLRDTDLVVSPAGRGGQVVLTRRSPPPAREGGPLQAPTGRVTGRVTDAATGAPLAGASVGLDGTRVAGASRADGRFDIGGAPPGRHTLVARLIGYSEARVEVEVQDGATSTVEVAMVVSPVQLDQVVVTGTVLPTELRTVPNPVTVITAEDIAARNLFTIDQIFRGMVPGAISADRGLGNYASTIYVRGSTSLTSGVATIKTYIDGVEVTNPAFIAGLDPSSVERIEIIRGPQAATIYGAEAINGVMQITTRGRIHGRPSVISMRSSVGTINSDHVDAQSFVQDHAIDLTGAGENHAFSVGASYRSTGQWLPEYGSSVPSLFAITRLDEGPFTVVMSGRFADQRFDVPHNPILRDRGYSSFQVAPNERIQIRHQTLGLQLSYRASERWEHTAVAGRDGLGFDSWMTHPRRQSPADTLLRVNQSTSSRLSIGYRMAGRFGRPGLNADVVGGVDHQRADGHSFLQLNTVRTVGTLTGTTSGPTRLESTATGFFVQAQVSLHDRLHLTTGLRSDRSSAFGSDFGSAISPRIGLAVTQRVGTLELKARGSLGESLRPPAPGRGAASVSATAVTLANPDLGPERQQGWDAGIELHSPWLTLAVTRFDQMAEGLIESVLVDATSSPPTFQSQNVGRIENTGWEVEARAGFGPLSVAATYSPVRSLVRTLSPSYSGALQVGDRMTGVPSASGALEAALGLRGGTTLNGVLTYRGGFTELDILSYYDWAFQGAPYRGSLRAYHLDYDGGARLDLGVSQRIGPERRVFLKASNVTNNRSPEVWNSLPVTGRVVSLGASLSTPVGGR